ncbi:MAG: S66 peptidase family protein [Chitinophagales bacterium]
MRVPSYLQKGDSVGIVCTARHLQASEITSAIQLLESWGLRVVLGKTLGLKHHQFAGTDMERAADFQEMLDNKEIKAIICGRGGYGTVRMIDKIDFSKFEQHPKWIVGFSDITVLHSHIHTNCGVATLHASMPIVFETNTERAIESLRKALFGENLTYETAIHTMNRVGEGRGEIIGGNLSLIYSLIGSNSDIDTKGKILMLEDLDEYLYHIDRMMMNLKRSGKLENLAGLLVGGMSDMNDNTTPFGKTAYEIIAEHTQEYEYPISFGFPVGHWPNNHAIYLGQKARLKVQKDKACMEYIAIPT